MIQTAAVAAAQRCKRGVPHTCTAAATHRGTRDRFVSGITSSWCVHQHQHCLAGNRLHDNVQNTQQNCSAQYKRYKSYIVQMFATLP